jgi:hypothetical protein
MTLRNFTIIIENPGVKYEFLLFIPAITSIIRLGGIKVISII